MHDGACESGECLGLRLALSIGRAVTASSKSCRLNHVVSTCFPITAFELQVCSTHESSQTCALRLCLDFR